MSHASPNLQAKFQSASTPKRPQTKTRPTKTTPISIRLTNSERQYLERRAGNRPLSQYAREKLLGSRAIKRKPSSRPTIDREILAQLLGTLGQSQLGPSMNQIARLAEKGALPLTPETKDEIKQACFQIASMRVALIKALGLKS